MLDFRMNTFLALCETRNYTEAAKRLHVTQPAVTQHIQYLENAYGTKLFLYQGRSLRLTEAGKRLREFALSVAADDARIREQMTLTAEETAPLRFGATLTIGEYTMPGILKRALEEQPRLKISMQVKNTQELLLLLDKGDVDFALIEGSFDRTGYETRLFSREALTGLCQPGFRPAGRESAPESQVLELEELLGERLIVREPGSGTRGILQQALYERNLTLSAFSDVIQLGSMNAIKSLTAAGCGITFLYEEAAKKELAQGSLRRLAVKDFSMVREFNFVTLKNSVHAPLHRAWFERFQRWREAEL